MTLTRDRKSALLSEARLFDGVDPDLMDRIAAVAVEGEIGTGFFVIVEGGARVVRDGETIATVGPGDFFGELSVLDGRPRVAQVIADGPTSCLALASWDFETVLLAEPRVSLAILRVFINFPDPWFKRAHRNRRIPRPAEHRVDQEQENHHAGAAELVDQPDADLRFGIAGGAD